jgi:hypothetical protein
MQNYRTHAFLDTGSLKTEKSGSLSTLLSPLHVIFPRFPTFPTFSNFYNVSNANSRTASIVICPQCGQRDDSGAHKTPPTFQSLATLGVGTRARAAEQTLSIPHSSAARARHLRPQHITLQLGLARANTNSCWGGGVAPISPDPLQRILHLEQRRCRQGRHVVRTGFPFGRRN